VSDAAATGTLIWQEPTLRAFAHEVATAADELRELAPLLRALGDLRVPADRAARLRSGLESVTRAATELQVALERDAHDLWAAASASTAMEAEVTAIVTRKPRARSRL
jgi:hypothetical protein